MNSKRTLMGIVLSLIIINLIISIQNVIIFKQNMNLGPMKADTTLLGSYNEKNIIFDGNLTESEWNYEINETFQIQCGEEIYDVILMIQNDLDSLYIGTILKGDQFNGTDIFFYSLDSDNNQETNEGTEDQKRIPCDMIHPTDFYYIESVGFSWEYWRYLL